ncbi:hypothetical protein [Priestia aryabhattai]
MYRLTLRCSDVYRTYIDEWFQQTSLSRNQIVRCALFTAANNPLFLEIMSHYKRSDVTPPSPPWDASAHYLWLEQDVNVKEEGSMIYDVIEGKGTSSSASKVLRTPTGSRRIPGASIHPSRSSYGEKESPSRCEPTSERRTGTLPIVQFSNNGGIRLDLR